MIPFTSITDFKDGDRLFYELGYKVDVKLGYGDNWRVTGNFKEIKNVSEFLQTDSEINNPEYIAHHNFMLLKP